MGKTLQYCDLCAKVHNLEVQANKAVKAECEICHKRIEPLNEIVMESQEFTTIQAGHFEVTQLDNFIPGLPANVVHPNLPYQSISNMMLFFPSIKDGNGKKSIIVADQETGEQVQIVFGKDDFKPVLVGTVSANGEKFTPAEG